MKRCMNVANTNLEVENRIMTTPHTKEAVHRFSSKSTVCFENQLSKIFIFESRKNSSFRTLQTEKWKSGEVSTKNLAQKWKFDKMEKQPRIFGKILQKWNSILSRMYCSLSASQRIGSSLCFSTEILDAITKFKVFRKKIVCICIQRLNNSLAKIHIIISTKHFHFVSKIENVVSKKN